LNTITAVRGVMSVISWRPLAVRSGSLVLTDPATSAHAVNNGGAVAASTRATRAKRCGRPAPTEQTRAMPNHAGCAQLPLSRCMEAVA
jgi:hypothetical protein